MPIPQLTGPGGHLLAAAALVATLGTGAWAQTPRHDGQQDGRQGAAQHYRPVRPPPGPARGLIAAPAWLVWAVSGGIAAGSLAVAMRMGRSNDP